MISWVGMYYYLVYLVSQLYYCICINLTTERSLQECQKSDLRALLSMAREDEKSYDVDAELQKLVDKYTHEILVRGKKRL